MSECIFCRIVSGDIEAERVHVDDDVVAFRDSNPQAPTHVLIVPRRHVSTVNDLTEADAGLISKLVLAARRIAHDEGIAEAGYRLVLNCNRGAGQSVFHIHLHLLGGRSMSWPPG